MNWKREELGFQEQQRLLGKLVARVKAFETLSPGEVGELLGRSEKCSYSPDAVIVKEGGSGSHMYVILDGEVVVSKQGYDGEMELARLQAPDAFGEMALTDNEVRSATVTALTPCVLVRLSDGSLFAKAETGLKVYRNIARILSQRLRSADEAIAWRL